MVVNTLASGTYSFAIDRMKTFGQNKKRSLQKMLPLFGCILFALLYFIATLCYPGGNYQDRNAKGFSWSQNYWCNLLNEKALNGEYNSARVIAFAAMIVLSVTLTLFWFLFPRWAPFKKSERYIVQVSGCTSMCIAIFIFTGLHDTIIDMAGLFGLIALTGTLIGLKRWGTAYLLYFGFFIIALIGLNNLLYYDKTLIFNLPVVQKITFLSFLL